MFISNGKMHSSCVVQGLQPPSSKTLVDNTRPISRDSRDFYPGRYSDLVGEVEEFAIPAIHIVAVTIEVKCYVQAGMMCGTVENRFLEWRATVAVCQNGGEKRILDVRTRLFSGASGIIC
jgi:hypothetical protein